jgi:hypothetical protein
MILAGPVREWGRHVNVKIVASLAVRNLITNAVRQTFLGGAYMNGGF